MKARYYLWSKRPGEKWTPDDLVKGGYDTLEEAKRECFLWTLCHSSLSVRVKHRNKVMWESHE